MSVTRTIPVVVPHQRSISISIDFKLSLELNGKPVIEFTHHDKSDSLDQKLLKVFIDQVKVHGMILKNPTGHLDSTNNISWEKYEIRINDKV